MPRVLRFYLLVCVVIAFGYLLLHAHESIRLTMGDTIADARVLVAIDHIAASGPSVPATAATDTFHPFAFPPLATVISATAGTLGIFDIGALRFIALALSGLGVLLMFDYIRRVWTSRIAAIATALWTTSVMWLVFADSIDQVPVLQATTFLGLWGLVRAIETQKRRFEWIAFAGGLLCFLASPHFWLFFAAATFVTIHAKLGDPFARGARRFVAMCVAGMVVGLIASRLFASNIAGWHELVDRKEAQPLATILRRLSLMYTPIFWITAVLAAWRAIRAATIQDALTSGATWMLATGIVTLYLAHHPGQHAVAAIALLPFYAVGSALLIAKLLDGDGTRRLLAWAWLVAAPAWGIFVMMGAPRAVLDRDDIARAGAYLASHDGNDFVLSNLVVAAPIEAAFGKRVWDRDDGPLEQKYTDEAFQKMLEIFAATGTDYVHVIMFTTPESRMNESAMWPLALKRHLWSATGWPTVQSKKSATLVTEFDKKLRTNLEAVYAKRVLRLGNFEIYRVDRATMVEEAGKLVLSSRVIDFGNTGSTRNKLLGWNDPKFSPSGIGYSPLDGFAPCPSPQPAPTAGIPSSNACETVSTSKGTEVLDGERGTRGELMIRVERVCDLRITIDLLGPTLLGVTMNDFAALQRDMSNRFTTVVPARSVHRGINLMTLSRRSPRPDLKADVVSVTIDPECETP